MSEPVRNLELHEAMVLVLLEQKLASGVPEMTTTDLAEIIRSRSLYLRRKGTEPTTSQVGSRVPHYPALFESQMRGRKKWVILRNLPRGRSQSRSH
jgi:hypothetical protein